MLKVQNVKNRGFLFTFDSFPDCNLNLYLIKGSKFNYIIDTGLGSSSLTQIKEYIKGNEKPALVINTHHHWDHIWGNNEFSDSLIVSHVLCRRIIDEKWGEMLEKYKDYSYGSVVKCLPNVVFDSDLYFPEDKIRLFYTPGHTIDSISILDEEEKVIIAGDNIGDTMEELTPSLYCEKENYINTLKKYKEIDFDTCISGHNTVLGKDAIEKIWNTIF